GQALALRPPAEEGLQPLVVAAKLRRKLDEGGAELAAQRRHTAEDEIDTVPAILQLLVVGDEAADLPGEEEAVWRCPRPGRDRILAGQAIEAGVELGGVEPARVPVQPRGVLQVGRIEGTLPVLVAPAGAAD